MKKSVVLGEFTNKELLVELGTDRIFSFFNNQSEAFRFHLDNPEIDSYIIEAQSFTSNQVNNIINNINYLNKMICIVVVGCNNSDDLNNDVQNISFVESNKEITEHFNTLDFSSREYNRVEWPLHVSFHKEESPKNRVSGLVLSLSLGGCLIRYNSDGGYETNEKVILTFKFKDFNFLVEGLTVRENNNELALKFHDISPMTASYLNEIINNEILAELKDIN